MDALPEEHRAMNSLAFRLRHRVDIEEFSTSMDSETGAVTEAWASILADGSPLIPAEIYPMSGREFVAAQSVQAGVTTKIVIRHIAGVLPSMRVIHGSKKYNIRAVLPDPTLARHITLMCEDGPNDG